jgi:hypothetical protein
MERLWKNAGATGRKRSERFKPRNGSTSQISFPPAATACPQNRMVRRGSTVRVRQRALQNPRKSAHRLSDPLAGAPICRGMNPFMELSDSEAARGGPRPPGRSKSNSPSTAGRHSKRLRCRSGKAGRPLAASVSSSWRRRRKVISSRSVGNPHGSAEAGSRKRVARGTLGEFLENARVG